MQACPECRKPLSEYADACPHCERPCAEILEESRREAEQLESTARLCAIVMPLAALALFCFTSIPATFPSALKLLGSNIATGSIRILGFLFYALLLLAFLALPILFLVAFARAISRGLRNR